MAQCFADATGEWCGTGTQATAGLDATLHTSLPVARRQFVVSRNHTSDCVAAGTTCTVAVSTLPTVTRVPLAFDPHVPIPPIRLSVFDDAVTKGTPGTQDVVTLSEATDHPVTIQYTTRHGNARPGIDYVEKVRHVTFLPGVTRHVISVAIVDDRVHETTERFHIDVDSVTGATTARKKAFVTITDDD